MKVNLSVKVVLKDKNNKVTKTIRKQCHSFVRQLIDCLHDDFSENNKESENDNLFYVTAISGDDTFGIQVGSGTNAVLISDNALQTLIQNGSSAGKLTYLATSVGVVVIVSTTAKFTVARTFTNNTVADIDVKEVGLRSNDGFRALFFQFERSLLSFTISAGTSGTVTYTVSVTV